MAWLKTITTPINWIWGSANTANTPKPDLLIGPNIWETKSKSQSLISREEKENLHQPIEAAAKSIPTWNDTINSFASSVMSLGSPFVNSLTRSRIKHLLLVDPKVEPFNPKHIKTPCLVREVTPQLSSQVIGKKYFIEPKIPFDQQKELVVLVHGARTTGNIFENIVEDLLQQGHPVLVGDMVGFGANKNIELTNQNLIRDVAGMIREASSLRSGEHISLVGHSLGTATIVAALKEIFKDEKSLNNSPEHLTKIDKVILISAWDKLAKVADDLLTQDPTKLQRIIDREIGHHDEGLEKVLRQKLNDPASSIESVLGQEFNTFDNLKDLLELNASRASNSKIQEFKFIHGKKDEFVGYQRSLELDQLAKSMKVNSSHALDEHGTHFDQRNNKGESSLPTNLIMSSLANPVRRNVIPDIEILAEALFEEIDQFPDKISLKLKQNPGAARYYEALSNFGKSKLAKENYKLAA